MYEVSNQLYLEVAQRLLSLVGQRDYLSGRLEFDFDSVACCMIFSAIVYRRTVQCEQGEVRLVDDVVPVWWEFHTTGEHGEVLNDFSFNVLRQYLRQTL